MRSKFAGMHPELNRLIASQLPEEMDMSAWSGGQGGEEVAKGGGMAPAPGVPKWMQQAHDAVFGQSKYERRLTPGQESELRVLQGNERMGFGNNAPGDRRRIDLELQKLQNRKMNQF